MDKTLFNGSGYKDATAYSAIRNAEHDNRTKLIADIKAMAERRGYKVIGYIRLKEIKEADFQNGRQTY